MKRKYCLIRNAGELKPDSIVYQIWVGSSLRDSTFLALVQEFCKDVGWYFELWSLEVDSQLSQRTKCRSLCGDRITTPYAMISLSIQQCYDAVVDDSFDYLEAHRVMTPQETRQRFSQAPAMLRLLNRKTCDTPCPPHRCKYLSRRRQYGFYDVAPTIALAILIFVLDAIVTKIFGLV